VSYRQKGCTIPGWSALILEENELSSFFKEEPSNIAVLLGDASGGLVDIDLDCPEAGVLAPICLPRTECVFGRAGNPGSHWIYRTNNPGKKISLSDPITQEILLEYRANGCATIFPGSVHESGEEVQFVANGQPTFVVREDLLVGVKHLAAASLIARRWPAEGGRHDASLALSGCLLRSGFTLESTIDLIRGICGAAGDVEAADRIECARTTSQRLAEEEPIASWKALNQIFGTQVSSHLRDLLSLCVPQQLVKNVGVIANTGDPTRLNDIANAERFAERNRDKAGYCHALKSWFVYDGKRWAMDLNGAIERLAMDTVRSIARDAAEYGGRAEIMWAWKSHAYRSIRDMLLLAQSLLSLSQDALDSDPWQLNCKNGTIDLRSGRLRDHDPKDHNSKLANVNFLPEEKCTTWLRFLDRIMAGNQRLIGFLQRASGYSLTARISEQCLFVTIGSGANGKTTFTDTLRYMLGEYGRQTPMDMLMVTKAGGIPTDLACLPGARYVTAVEAEQGRRLAEVKIKQMTGGDRIAARHLYGLISSSTPRNSSSGSQLTNFPRSRAQMRESGGVSTSFPSTSPFLPRNGTVLCRIDLGPSYRAY
jgi:putative DNA primase/helicase